MLNELKIWMATAVFVSAAVACVPASQTQPRTTEKQADANSAPQTFEVLVQYRDDTKEAEKAVVRKSVAGSLKEQLSTPGLEVLLVPKTKKLDSADRVVDELRRNKAVRIAEPQRTYSKQSGGRT